MAFLTPRPMPERRLPVVAGGLVVGARAADLPHRRLAASSGWALGAVLWVASQLIGLVLDRAGIGAPNIQGSGVVAFGMMTSGIVLMVVAIAVATVNPTVAVAGALVYAAAFTVELGLGLSTYFSGGAKQ